MRVRKQYKFMGINLREMFGLPCVKAVFKDEALFVQSPDTRIEVEEYTVPAEISDESLKENREAANGTPNSAENTKAVTAICERIQTDIRIVEVPESMWCEVDDADDLARARKKFG